MFRFINPVKLLHELEDALDEDSIIVADGGDFVGTAAYILKLVSVCQYIVLFYVEELFDKGLLTFYQINSIPNMSKI